MFYINIYYNIYNIVVIFALRVPKNRTAALQQLQHVPKIFKKMTAQYMPPIGEISGTFRGDICHLSSRAFVRVFLGE